MIKSYRCFLTILYTCIKPISYLKDVLDGGLTITKTVTLKYSERDYRKKNPKRPSGNFSFKVMSGKAVTEKLQTRITDGWKLSRSTGRADWCKKITNHSTAFCDEELNLARL